MGRRASRAWGDWGQITSCTPSLRLPALWTGQATAWGGMSGQISTGRAPKNTTLPRWQLEFGRAHTGYCVLLYVVDILCACVSKFLFPVNVAASFTFSQKKHQHCWKSSVEFQTVLMQHQYFIPFGFLHVGLDGLFPSFWFFCCVWHFTSFDLILRGCKEMGLLENHIYTTRL